MNQSKPTPTQSMQPSLSNPVPQTIQIQIPAEMLHPSALAPTKLGDITPSLTLIAFAILVKVTMDYLKPTK